MKLALLWLIPAVALAQVSPSVETDHLGGGPITSGDDTVFWQLEDGGVMVLVTNSASMQNAGVQAFNLTDGTFVTNTVDGPAVAADVRYGLEFDGGAVDVVLGVYTDGTFRLYTPGSAGLLSHLTLGAGMGSLVTPSAGALAWYDNELFVFIGDFTGVVQQWRVDVDGGAVGFTKVAARRLGTRQIRALAGDELHRRMLVSMAGAGLGSIPLDPNADAGLKVIDKEDGGSFGASPFGIAVYPVPQPDAGAITLVTDFNTDRVGVYVGDKFVLAFTVTANGAIGAVHAPLGVAALSSPGPVPFNSGAFGVVDSQNAAGPNVKLVPWAAIVALNDTLFVDHFDERTLPHAPVVPDAGPVCPPSDGGDDGGRDGGDGGCGTGGGAGGGGGSAGTGGVHIGGNPGMPYEDHRCGCGSFGAFGGALWLLGLALRRKNR